MKVNIDVLVTCYNKEPYLDEAITSLIRQSAPPRNIILVHDGCDNPQAHVHATTIILPENKGVIHSRHEAFRYSQAPLVLFMDGDDILSHDYLEKMVLQMKKSDVAYPDTYIWYGDPSKSDLKILPKKLSTSWLNNFLTMKDQHFLPVTCLMKREVYERLGGFADLPVFEDWQFWLRAMAQGFKFSKAETLLTYRRFGNTRNNAPEPVRRNTIKEISPQFQVKNGAVHAKIPATHGFYSKV